MELQIIGFRDNIQSINYNKDKHVNPKLLSLTQHINMLTPNHTPIFILKQNNKILTSDNLKHVIKNARSQRYLESIILH